MDSFGAKGSTDGEFLFLFSDIPAEIVQYSGRTNLCKSIESLSLPDVIEYIRKSNYNIDDFMTSSLKNTTYDPNKAGRQWMFMSCNELGYW